MTLSAVIAQSLTLDAGRAALIALLVLVATAVLRFVWGWLMKSAREDFRESIGKIVDEKIGSLQISLMTMADDLGTLASALKDERSERDDLRHLIESSVEELSKSDEETAKTLVVVCETLEKHGQWIEQIAQGSGIALGEP